MAGAKDILNLHHARKPEQLEKMKKLLAEGKCPFCPEFLEEYHDNLIEVRSRFWSVTKNDYPYTGATTHLLVIYRDHITRPEEMVTEAMVELMEIFTWINENYDLPGGAILMRFGDTDYTGASVDHLHLHVVSGGKRKEGAQPLISYIGYQEE